MDRLWAPWRSKYVYLRKHEKCIFCISKKPDKIKDKKRYIVERSIHSFSMLNIYPYNNGHVMAAPYRHVKSPELLSDSEILDLMKLVNRIKCVLDKTLKPHGYNIGANIDKVSGAGFDGHFHIHIVPRWTGDANFITVLSDTKVLSESLDKLYNIFKKTIG